MGNAFDDAFTALIGNEGGYANNPKDPGGETMWGITAKLAREFGYVGAMRDLPQATAKDIAKRKYWDPYRCNELDPKIAFEVFDTAYNGGRPVIWLQLACGVKPDGMFGSQTMASIQGMDPVIVVARFNAYRLAYYTSLPTWSTFGRGWANRIAHNLLLGAK